MIYNIKQIKKGSVDGLSDVITEVILDYCIEENGNTVCAYCRVDLNNPSQDNFVPYVDVTKEMLIAWLKEKIDFSDFDDGLRLQLKDSESVVANPF